MIRGVEIKGWVNDALTGLNDEQVMMSPTELEGRKEKENIQKTVYVQRKKKGKKKKTGKRKQGRKQKGEKMKK